MHPWPAHPANPPIPPHPHPNSHRSWSDDHISANQYARSPVRPGPRSSSFSASRAPRPKWDNYPPLPPVPPLPPSLLPGFESPALAHANLDFAFAATPQRRPSVPQTSSWTGAASYAPSSPHEFSRPGPRSETEPTLPWAPPMPHAHFDPNPSFGPPPVVPPRPTTSYVPNTPSLVDRRPSTYGLAQDFRSHDYSSLPPPAIPARPTTAHGEIRFERSRSTRSQAAPSTPLVPPVPPKTLTSPITPTLPFSNHARTPSPPAQVSPPSPPLNTHTIPESPETVSPQPENQPSENLPSDDLKRALTMSLAESRKERPVDKNFNHEDDELTRALAESLAFSTKLDSDASRPPKHSRSHTEPSSSKAQIPVQVPVWSVDLNSLSHLVQDLSEASATSSGRRPSVADPGGRDILTPQELEDHVAHGKIMQELEDEEVTRKLQEEESERLALELREREGLDEERARRDAEVTKQLQEEEARCLEAEKRERERRDEERARMDEELARREETEEKAQKLIREAQERKDAEMARSLSTNNVVRAPVHTYAQSHAHAPMHTHAPAYSRAPVPTSHTALPLGAHGPAVVLGAPGLPQYNDVVISPPAFSSLQPGPRATQSAPLLNGSSQQMGPVRAVSAIATGSARPTEHTEFTRSATMNAGATGRHGNNGLAPEGVLQRSQDPSPGSSSVSSAGPSTVAPPPQDNAVEPDLLKGVSYGFKPPDTQSAPAQLGELPPCAPFPEVISLFRAPSPPFHIMAPSWRHLMRLLAQLETRIEANLDVIARSKEDNHLRVVVQFAKLPYTANTWRTILHLSLDEPVPRNTQNAWRFTNGDTNVLPYSYSLGVTPPYLINSHLSQIYVIPLSATSPFPILPISLPNLALYLQSAMRDSRARKVQNDPSNGMRRLAKIVTACYPDEIVNPDKEERKPSRGVGGLFKQLVGRGGDRGESQGNEDVYDIITPFRIDQYTTT